MAPDASAPLKLLVVEDSAADLRLLREALNDGAPADAPAVLATRTMAEAEAALRAEPFDCVLMDLGLPDGNGVDNVRRLRVARAGQTVVVISGSDGEDVAIQSLRHGAQDYLHKGDYTGEVILRVVRRAIERNQQLLTVERERDEQFKLATRDTLTGVSNRRLLEQLAQHTIAQSARHGWRFAVAFLDLDGFKHVNDTHGHACGDLLLREVGKVLACGVRDIDTVARIGGDEFLLLLAPPLELGPVRSIIRRIQELISAITRIDGHPVAISASVGMAIYPDHADSLAGLMACADQAMYRAKHAPPERLELFAPLGSPPPRAAAR